MTVAPLIANGVLITGISGAEFGMRGFIDGWDPETGKQLWRRYTIPARGEKGNETWPQDTNAWEVGGGSSWITGSYDPELDLIYLGHRQSGAVGFAVAARRQSLHVLGAGAAAEDRRDRLALPVHAERRLRLRRQLGADPRRPRRRRPERKVMMQLNRNGFLYVLDRTNGKLISAKPFEKVNWASHVDMETGRPVETEVAKTSARRRAGRAVAVARAAARTGRTRRSIPETGLLYANTMHAGEDVQAPGDQAARRRPALPCSWKTCRCREQPASRSATWKRSIRSPARRNGACRCTDFQIWSAMLATGGGLLFTGKETGEFIALDADTGKTLWQFQTGSGINAMPVTFTHKGRQYVTVLSGIGGLVLEHQRASGSRTWCRKAARSGPSR